MLVLCETKPRCLLYDYRTFFIESCHSPLSSARGPLLYENVNRSQGLYVFILMDKRLYISLSLSKWLIIIGSWKKDTSLGFAQTRCRFFVSLFLHPNALFELTNKKAEKTVFNWNQSTETILASWNVDDSFSLAVHNFVTDVFTDAIYWYSYTQGLNYTKTNMYLRMQWITHQCLCNILKCSKTLIFIVYA